MFLSLLSVEFVIIIKKEFQINKSKMISNFC